MKAFRIAIVLFLSSLCLTAQAQDIQDRISRLFREDSTDIQTIAMYPAETRSKLLLAATHPEALARISDANKKSNEQFRGLISGYSKDDQERIWNLTRFDGLIQKMAKLNPPSEEALEEILKPYPKEAQEDARVVGIQYPSVAGALAQQQNMFTADFDQIVNGYSGKDQDAFQALLQQPEVLSILNNNMDMTVRLGDLYKSDPVLINNEMDALALQLASQKAKDTEEWKQTVQKDTAAKQELQEAAKDYAKEKGYREDELTNVDIRIIEHPVFYPYPYWCGYPYWHESPYWYPYPYWYHSGFYFWNGNMVIIGPPSWYFIHWHFNHHPHFYHYPHLSGAYINYYYGPRRSTVQNSREVNTWVNENRSNLPRDFFVKDKDQPERIRAFGRQEPRQIEHRDIQPEVQPTRPKQNELSEPKVPAPPREISPVKPSEPKQIKPSPKIEPATPVPQKEKVTSPVITPKQTPREVKPAPIPKTPKQDPAKTQTKKVNTEKKIRK